jgi:hypothetical protein
MVKVLTIIMMDAVTTANRAIMFIARTTLRMMKPGPASFLLGRGIFDGRLVQRGMALMMLAIGIVGLKDMGIYVCKN